MNSTLKTCSGDRRSRSGQAILFFLMILVILVFVVLWNYDLHKILYVKFTSQNAGDSAALIAARWQGITLNLIGDLNIMHAVALSSGDDATASAITNVQARLLFTGPMIALEAAQQAAKNNHIYSNSDYSDFLREHAQKVRDDYPSMTSPSGDMLFPEPYPGCWKEYADMLELIANEGVSAGPDTMQLYTDAWSGHILLDLDFYDAVAGKQWCWFFLTAPDLLEDYSNFFPCWWDPLPIPDHVECINSEIFGLGLTKQVTSLGSFMDATAASAYAVDRSLGSSVSDTTMDVSAAWYCYAGNWGPWDSIKPSGGQDSFPVTGNLRPQYDYAGADAAVRIEAGFDRITPGHKGSNISDNITWSAAAKPFGYLNQADRPTDMGIVLPAFREIRMIPVDTSSAPVGGGYNLPWRRHIEVHLPKYLENGPSIINSDSDMKSCWYCLQLVTWENEGFRQEGIDWLKENSALCTISPPGGGGGGGGGTRRGH